MGALYQIIFPNGKSYIGITRLTAERRFATHRYQAKGPRTHSIYCALRKYGRENAQLKTLLVADYDYLREIESKAITAFQTKVPHGYNMTDGGEGTPNPTAETRAKISAGHRGQPRHTTPHTAETKAKLSLLKKGRKLPASHRENIRLSLIRRAPLLRQYRLGKQHSSETKAQMALSARGIPKACNSTGYVGVSVDAQTRRWRAHITVNGRMVHLGRYQNIEDAVAARRDGEREYFQQGLDQ